MADEQMDDLKQFFTATVSQTEARLEERINQVEMSLGGRIDRLETRIDLLDAKTDDGFVGIAEAIEQLNQRLDTRDEEVDRRLTRLEQQAA